MPKTILVVDDKSSVRKLLREYLTEQNYKVVPAANGREALYAARHSKPDLILLDIMMPEMDGYEFLRQYRLEDHAPVIIITAREEETDAVLGLELGADDYVIKPFRMKELEARIRAVLRRAEPVQDGGKTLRVGSEIRRCVAQCLPPGCDLFPQRRGLGGHVQPQEMLPGQFVKVPASLDGRLCLRVRGQRGPGYPLNVSQAKPIGALQVGAQGGLGKGKTGG